LDEAHHAAAKTYRQLNKTAWAGIYHRFYLTATPFRTQPEESILFESIAGQVIYELTYASAVAQGLIVPVEAYYIEVPKVKNDYYTWAEVYSNLVVKNDIRNEMIALTLARLNAANLSTLCLVKEVAHGAKIEALTALAFANGKDDDTRSYIKDFNSGEIKSLIGTEGLLGEGVDSRPCEYVIVAGLGKARGAFMQKVGRAVRTYPGKDSAKVIIIKDLSHRFTARHFREQCKILKEYYGITPTKLDL
jgi:superfamily II DNA or RNA helicase